MYNNIGEKIKNWALWTFIIEAIGSIIGGLVIINESPVGLFLILGGPIVAWVSSWLLYGFGEIITKLDEIAKNTSTAKQPICKPSEEYSVKVNNATTTEQTSQNISDELPEL